ncbi:MAG: NAD(P)-binding domain-containing protein, partial [Clostridiales bacterium]|nr:NAD(P)-binding domain-containing protein [Clostridiales bacterium]
MINVGFIGAGNMGFAIMKGIAESEFGNSISMHAFSPTIKLFAFDPDSEKIKKLAQYGIESCTSESEIFEKCKYVFLAVKPQMLGNVLETVSQDVKEDNVIVSICAGITGDFIKSKTIDNAKVVLVMPNTPVLL